MKLLIATLLGLAPMQGTQTTTPKSNTAAQVPVDISSLEDVEQSAARPGRDTGGGDTGGGGPGGRDTGGGGPGGRDTGGGGPGGRDTGGRDTGGGRRETGDTGEQAPSTDTCAEYGMQYNSEYDACCLYDGSDIVDCWYQDELSELPKEGTESQQERKVVIQGVSCAAIPGHALYSPLSAVLLIGMALLRRSGR